MATDTRNIDLTISDDATFRAAAQAVHDALVAAGLTQAADTGQINLTTVTRPAGTSTAAGYEIWRMNDTDQANHPIFFKLEYGTAGATTRMGMWLTFGTGSNGAGTITNAGTRTAVNPQTTGNTATYASATDGGFFISSPVGAANGAWYFGAQRTRDQATGTQKSPWIAFAGTGSFSGMVWNPNTLSWSGGMASMPFWPDLASGLMIGGNATDVTLCPALIYNGKMDYASFLAADGDDVTLGTSFTITMPEGSRTFMPLDAANAPKPAGTSVLCIPWE